MKIDEISSLLVGFAFYVDRHKPGTVSENWLDEKTLKHVKDFVINDPNEFRLEFYAKLNLVEDDNRKIFLEQLFESLLFQLSNGASDLESFYQNTIFTPIVEVSDHELITLQAMINNALTELNLTHPQVQEKCLVHPENVVSEFHVYLDEVKTKIPPRILDFRHNHLDVEIVSNKPWSAFNQHIALFTSKIWINTDLPITSYDLKSLSQHEVWAGHHNELCNKDMLLVNEGRGEHGIVITYSPQTFFSEALAVGMFDLLDLNLWLTKEERALRLIDALIFGLHNKTTFLLYKHKWSKEKIRNWLDNFPLSVRQKDYILGFSLDPTYGRYAAIYHTSGEYLKHICQNTANKASLLLHLFTQPASSQSIKSIV